MTRHFNNIKKQYKSNKKFALVINLLVCILIMFVSVGFATMTKNLNIRDLSAIVRLEDEVRITSVNVGTVTSDASSNWEDYDVASIKSGFNLPNPDSTIAFTVDIIVFNNNEYGIYDITGLPDNLQYTISGYTLKERICDNENVLKCNLGAKKTIDIIISYAEDGYRSDNISYAMDLNFEFRRMFSITYDGILMAGLPKAVFENETLDVTFDKNYSFNVRMDNVPLSELTDYSYRNKKLVIEHVTGNVLITRLARTLGETVLAANTVSKKGCPEPYSGNNNYYSITGQEDKTMFCTAVDDYGTTYYYRGETENNYLSFAGYRWRIVRVNGDGSIRITTEEPIDSVEYYIREEGTLLSADNLIYKNSNLETNLNTWYENVIQTNYSDYIADSSFCNDMTTYESNRDLMFRNSPLNFSFGGDISYVDGSTYNGNRVIYYGGMYRIVAQTYEAEGTNIGPQYVTYTCPIQNYRYTVDRSKGNGQLTHPIGTLTADDLIFAGVKYSNKDGMYNIKNPLQTNMRFWTLTPAAKISSGYLYGSVYYPSGRLEFDAPINSRQGYRPVINLKEEVYVTGGNGTSLNPYTITTKNITISSIEQKIQDMSLEEKIGQMIIMSASGEGKSLTTSFRNKLRQVKPGGVIFLTDNFSNYNSTAKKYVPGTTAQAVKDFVSGVQATADIPMFISIDQEGGRVQRLSGIGDVPITEIPPMYDVGLNNNQRLSYDIGRIMGEELGVFGFNMDFAPVADVWSNPGNSVIGNRSFSNDSTIVSNQSVAVANGLSSTGVIPVYKHYPGHGDTASGEAGDTHVNMAKIPKTIEQLEETELVPFRNAVANGAKVIMVSHLNVPALTGEDGLPISMSYNAINNYLKGNLGFNGVVITDGLNMGALTSNFSQRDVLVSAINAGVDILLAPVNPVAAVNEIAQAVRDGYISEETINNAVRKILKLKEEMVPNHYNDSYLNNDDHKEVVKRVYPDLSTDYPEFNIDYKNNVAEYVQSAANVTSESYASRYQGLNVNNYVVFNNERWRIIGSFQNNRHGQGSKVNLVKIVSDNSVADKPYNTKGDSDYSTSSIKQWLNVDYYNSLPSNYKNMIQTAKWYYGGYASVWANITNIAKYELQGNGTLRPYNVTDNIGLISVSDYLMAAPVSGSNNGCVRTTNANSGSYNSTSKNCATNNWFNDTQDSIMTIHSEAKVGNPAGPNQIVISDSVFAQFTGVTANAKVYPTLYLKENVRIVNGDGSYDYPFILEYTE